MPTDELSFPDLDDALRDLRADSDAPAGWHDAQRAALLTFIETGDVVIARPERRADSAAVIALDSDARPRPRHRLAVLLAAAAAAVALLAAGLAVAPRWRGEEVPPATQPGATDGVVPFPDRYPVLPAGHPMESRVTALFDGQFDWSNEPQSWMIVGRLVDEVVVESIHISSTTMSPAEAGAELTGSPQAEPVDAVGEGWKLYRDVAFLSDVLVGRRGPATLVIAGADPVATLGAMGGLGFIEVSADSAGEPFIGVTTVPDDYRVIFGPESRVPGAMSAALTIPDGEGTPDPTLPDPRGDEGDGITVRIDRNGPFLRQVDGLRRVEIGDVEGWVRTDPGSPVTWKVSETTWATVWDAADTDVALEFARSLEFVDRATWVERYDVPDPQYPAGPPPDTPTSSIPEVAMDEFFVPDRFAIVPDDHPLADQATASWGGQIASSNGERASAAVARVVDGVATDGVQLIVYASVDNNTFPLQDSRRMTVAGVEGTLYTEPGTPPIRTFVADGSPALAVQALDPVAFIETAGGLPVANVRVDGAVSFDVGALPDGYSVIAPPARLPLGAVSASTRIPDGANADGLSLEVGLLSPLPSASVVGSLARVDIDGLVGWQLDRGPGSTVIWQVSETTWAQVGGAISMDDALAYARSVEFVDRATWEARYGVTMPDFGGVDVPTGTVPGTTVPPLESGSADELLRLDCDVIGSSPSNFDQRIEVDCGAALGVLVGMPVVVATSAADALIGKVTQTSPSTAVVMLVTNPQFSVQAVVGTGPAGIASGGGSDEPVQLAPIGAGDGDSIPVGAEVRTARGEDSLAPAGLVIGSVVGPSSTPDRWDVAPSADLDRLQIATVLLYVPERERI